MIDEFFRTARERHRIYLRRQEGRRRPWTRDEIMHTYKFTNVFRELDRTTVWLRKNAREEMRSRPEVLLAVVLFRWFNRTTTGEAIFLQKEIGGVPPGRGSCAMEMERTLFTRCARSVARGHTLPART